MLNHFAAGPAADGRYIVAYKTPGCSVLTTVMDCPTLDAADSEAKRMNERGILREKQTRWERELRGLGGVYPDLKGIK